MTKISTRELVLAGAGLVGVSTAATSAVSLYELAVQCGIPEPLSAALPIALDAGAAVAALAWITEEGERRAWARGIAIAALVASLVGNGLQHAIASHLLPVTLWLVLVVGACIPAMLWAVVHLSALMMRTPPAKSAPRTKTVPEKQRARQAAPTPPAPAVPAPVAASSVVPAPDDLAPKRSRRDQGKDWARANWPVTGQAIADAVGVSRGEGDRIRKTVRDELEAVS